VISNDRVTVTTVVETDPASAFRFFTDEIDLWWKRSDRYRIRNGRMRFDATHLLEADEPIGEIKAWEPEKRLVLELFTWSFRSGEHTQVEVRFEPVGTGTRVTIEHRAWTARTIGREEFRTTVALWWGALLPSLRKVVVTETRA
jgi:Activator of Hsp90 ATPase homolog 1-like protein